MQIHRRNFLKQSAVLGVASLLPSFAHSMAPGFRLLMLATNWGFPGTIDEFCKRAKDAGYDGIEVWWKDDDALFAALDKYNLEVGFLCTGNSNEYTKHAASFEAALSAATSQQRKRPLYINCHSGKDYFSFEQNSRLIDITTRIAQETKIPVYHETHRSRMLFAAHVARQFIETKPALRLTLDISHWCNASASSSYPPESDKRYPAMQENMADNAPKIITGSTAADRKARRFSLPRPSRMKATISMPIGRCTSRG